MNKPLKVFITYSHKNTAEKDELITRLALLKREGIISIWHDNEILPGDKWRDAIFYNLADSDLLLYLTSAHSLDSENCNKELASALNAEIRVIPIILENCDWLNHQLSDFQALPDKGNPINKWQPESEGWQNVVDGIRNTVDEMQTQAKSSSESVQIKRLAGWVLQQGNFLLMLKEINMAIEAYSHAIDLNPDNAAAYNNRGTAYSDIDEYVLAIQDFDKAIGLDLKLAEAYNNRGIAYKERGELDRAIKDFDKALELKSDFTEAYNNRGNAYRNMDNLPKAFADYNRAIRFNSKFAQAYSNRGVAYGIKDKIDEAIDDFTRAIELNPDFAEAYYNRGNAYLLKGDFDPAIKNYDMSIKLDPNDAPSYCSRGNVYYQKDELDFAIKDYTTATELDPQLAPAYYNRGEVWLHLQEWENAKTDLTTAKRIGADIIAAFHNSYKNVESYEQRHRIKLPKDIALLLTQRRRDRYPKLQKVLDADGKPLESPNVVNLREQLRNAGIPLGEYVKTKPAFGINTTPTDVFVVDKAVRDELIAAHPSSADILKPFLHGQNLRRWHVDTPYQWLIFTHRGIAINDYPAILKHLEKYQETLSKRKGKQKWYELPVSLGDTERFAQPKLVCPDTYNHQTFAVDTDGYYYGKTSYLIPTEEKWLCGLLNSRTVEWFYSQVSNQLTIDPLRARSGYIQQIPIPDITPVHKALIAKIVDYLIYLQQRPEINSKDLKYARDRIMLGYFERVIDGLIYEAYLPVELHKSDKVFLQPLLDEGLPSIEDIQGDKMSAFRDIFELLYDRMHLVRRHLYYLDVIKPIRVIQGKL